MAVGCAAAWAGAARAAPACRPAGATAVLGSYIRQNLRFFVAKVNLNEQARLGFSYLRPIQVAYGRAQRTHAGFAERHGLPGRTFEPSTAGRASQGAKSFLDTAVEAVGEADHLLVEIQDSMMPVEVGDAQLRAGLAEARELVGPLAGRAHELVRILGR